MHTRRHGVENLITETTALDHHSTRPHLGRRVPRQPAVLQIRVRIHGGQLRHVVDIAGAAEADMSGSARFIARGT